MTNEANIFGQEKRIFKKIMGRYWKGSFKRGNTNIYKVILASGKNIHTSEISGFI